MATWRLDGEALPASAPLDAVRAADRILLQGGATAVGVRIGHDLHVSYQGRTYVLSDRAATRARGGGEAATGELRAPMPGTIVEILAQEGEIVAKGRRVVVMEAMKTQQILAAPFDGLVASLAATPGAQVTEGQLLAKIVPSEALSGA